MDKKILISSKPPYIHSALVEDGRLLEFISDSETHQSLVGNIYTGRVERILPARFAFIDIGQPLNAFLFLNDKREQGFSPLRVGQNVVVQVKRDASGEKGAAVSRELSFGGHLLALNVTNHEQYIAVSRKIDNGAEIKRLKNIVADVLPFGYDAIIRTDANNCSEQELRDELAQLLALAKKSREVWAKTKPPALLRGQLSSSRGVNELYRRDVTEIMADDQSLLDAARETIGMDSEAVKFTLTEDALALYDIRSQLRAALYRKTWLPCGGFLYIEKTEALYVIDVNTGKFSGKIGHEASMLKLNLEAAAEIAHQMQLRNIGGIIIIDFVDMKDEDNRATLTEALRNYTRNDRLSVNVLGLTQLGLMEVTRKRLRPGLMEPVYDDVFNSLN